MKYAIRYIDYDGEIIFTCCESEQDLNEIESYCEDLMLLYHVYRLTELY